MVNSHQDSLEIGKKGIDLDQKAVKNIENQLCVGFKSRSGYKKTSSKSTNWGGFCAK
jgi:hypothetical protein